MEKESLSSILRREARLIGLCDEWYNSWNKDASPQELIDKYFDGLDFPMKHHWPSNEFIKNNFDKGLLRKNNLLVDDKYSVLNPAEMVALGNTVSTIRINGISHSSIYARDKSRLNISVRGKAFVIIHLFDQSNVDVNTFDTPNVLLLIHSNNAFYNVSDMVKVKKELDYLK